MLRYTWKSWLVFVFVFVGSLDLILSNTNFDFLLLSAALTCVFQLFIFFLAKLDMLWRLSGLQIGLMGFKHLCGIFVTRVG